jgi:hypothetical protein
MRRVGAASLGIAIVVSVCAFSGAPVGASSPTAPNPHRRSVDGTQAFMRAAGRGTHGRVGLPSWNGSFSQGGTIYPYTMLGTDPSAGSDTTTLRVDIVPVSLTFDDGGITLNGRDMVSNVLASPLFERATYRSGHTQYADAMQRAEFWNDVQTKSRGYHVLLDRPRVLSTLQIEVPAGSGSAVNTPNGPRGVVTTPFLLTLLPRVSDFYDPGAVLVFLVKDVSGDTFLGFHFSFTPPGKAFAQTLIFAGAFTPGIVTNIAHSDVYVLSHEVAEWMNDPYLSNTVPQWVIPGEGTCFSNILEVGDPVEFLPNDSFAVTIQKQVFHVTDVAGVSWFAHDVPSHELGGAYSYNGTLNTFSTLC